MDDQPNFKRSKISEIPLVDLEPNLLESSVTHIDGPSLSMEVGSMQAEQINTKEDPQFPNPAGIGDSYTTSMSNLTDQINEIANKLCEHELFVIFKNSCLSTNDLLNFRLVNRTWRDAATSVLTNRNQCQLIFTVIHVEGPTTNEMGYKDYVKVYCNARKQEMLLKDLVELIPASPEFPATRLCFLNSYVFGSSTSTETCNDDYVEDLLKFLALYGHKIKSLSLGNLISRKELRDVLTIHTPNLDYLDLSSLTAFLPDQSRKVIWERRLAVPLPIKTVRLGSCFSELCETATAAKIAVLEILRNLNLKAIEDPNHYLNLIVSFQIEQNDNLNDNSVNFVSLVKDLEYKPTIANYSTFRSFSKWEPKLARLTVNCNEMVQFSSLHYQSIVKYLNAIIESSKNTLEHFEISFNPRRFLHSIKIPPLKNLKCLKLIQTKPCFLYEGPHQQPLNPLDQDLQLDIFLFQKNKSGHVSRNYFPKLTQVCMDVQDFQVQGKLMGFFRYKSTSPVEAGLHRKEGIFASSVKHLELCGNLRWPNYSAIKLMSTVFSGMTCIKIKCEHAVNLSVSQNFWSLCPSAKYIEIYGVSNGILTPEKAVQFGVLSNSRSEDVDSFFTGFPGSLCHKLQSSPFPKRVERDDASIDFFRLNPSFICSLKNLKILKIKFKELSLPFATKVTGMYAFRKMPQTRFIFSYDVTSMTATDITNMEKYLEPVAPYVEIVEENSKNRTEERCCGNKWL